MNNSVNQEELAMLELARSGDTEALEYFFSKYQSVIYWKSTQYFLQGAERDDLIQEAMIGLFKAIRDYDKTKEASFRSFAEMCINRQLLSAVKRASRQKNIPLNNSVSLDTPMAEDDVDWTLLDVISEKAAETPEDFLIKNEDLIHVARQLEKVTSEFEKEVLKQYLEGKSYQEMALYFNKKEKAIDNALQRVKKKMMKQLE
ncbi:RNA polymerase sporulation specific sigma factor SigH [Listeria monocytogenes FSL J1-208]|uniref:RNA polymerase sporulation sigma factor SigH n=1 Tax=Listeria monocytogenes TaxID=1639 RepID=UPI000254853A|nr:RNA polymerase sporulation sigma factor SigH [Listeria monocytogenes]EAE5923326.1 RNA polymerase sporulation sigma factor SigH [Listeria monocytogenes]EAG6688953.1 RNA polymerase sporulation sigma factor SigH [Listeria monocytogenes]EDK4068755.1 RNA polymerase sporulation sigma factor SigH [Listeria monocytogenes]EEU7817042.1 RNA polymerase sporulation sigma factor SigH [Listeria monocytogenes]EHY63977.1 RNA polymerase sporulation specific sigma factor SigH [Listeria monocytogenes FSL J1-20